MDHHEVSRRPGSDLRRYDSVGHLSIEETAQDRDQSHILVLRVAMATNAFLTQVRRKLELGPNERHAVEALWEYGPMPMSELADRIVVSRAAVTALIDRLEALDWVVRRADEVDRRRTIVALSPEGAERGFDIIESWLHKVQRSLGSIDAECWPAVRDALVTLHRLAAEEADAERVAVAGQHP